MIDYKGYKMENGAVTFLDVVGWVGIWQRKNDALIDLKDLIEYLKEQSIIITNDRIGKQDKELRGTTTEIKSISDTIVFLTPGNPNFSLTVHGELCKLAIAWSIKKGIPLRGATSYGSYDSHDNIFIGPAMDEAAAWHERTDWFGSVLTPSALFCDFTPNNEETWIKYNAPLSNGENFETFCVNWIEYFNKDIEKAKETLLQKFRDLGPIVPEIASKYTNTLKFYNSCNK